MAHDHTARPGVTASCGCRIDRPAIDADTRSGVAHVNHACGSSSGHEVVYRVGAAAPTVVDAYVVDREATDVDVRILAGGVPAGTFDVIVDARNAATEGEFLVVIQAR